MTTSETASPLTPLLDQISLAARNHLDLVAIAMATALPDICAALEAQDGRTAPDRYKAWCRHNLDGPEFSFVTADDLYSLRCGVLHQGRTGDLKHGIRNVVFFPTVEGNPTVTNCRTQDTYLYGVETFCLNVIKSVQEWYESNKTNPVVVNNSQHLVQYRMGLAPFPSIIIG